MTPQEFCTFHHACQEGEDFAMQFQSMADVWDKCPGIDWLLWMYGRTGVPRDDRALRLFAVWCARSVSHLLTDPRSLAAIDTAERYANGQASAEELTTAGSASASASASAASAASASWASASARSASWASPTWASASWASASWASASARSAAASASWASASWAASSASASTPTPSPSASASATATASQCDQFRKLIPNPFKSQE